MSIAPSYSDQPAAHDSGDAESVTVAELNRPGQLLAELEARQDEALVELAALDAQLIEVLEGLGATPVRDESSSPSSEKGLAGEACDDSSERRRAAA